MAMPGVEEESFESPEMVPQFRLLSQLMYQNTLGAEAVELQSIVFMKGQWCKRDFGVGHV